MIDPRGLVQRLDSVRSRYARSGIEVVGTAEHAALLAELGALGECIDATRRELETLSAVSIGSHVPDANSELDAIVLSTAAATDTILTTCEQLDSAIAGMPEACMAPVRVATTRIFEACNFQDITGQRAAKVGRVLKLIDGTVADLVLAFGHHEPADTAHPGRSLLNGPQRGAAALDQSAVDALFGSAS